jgi:hypothetical protein
MLDRARWTGKMEEAEVYRRWLVGKLSTPLVETNRPQAMPAPTAVQTAEPAAEDEVKKAA